MRNPDSSGPSASSGYYGDELARLSQEGGVAFMNFQLAAAVPPHESSLPSPSNVREWQLKDISRMKPQDQKEWRHVCHEELDSLRKREVFELVDLPKGRKTVRNRWVFDIKSDGRKKARLVAKGFSQVEGIDYNEIFSPVMRFETVHIMLALAALQDWHISALDVKTAFLYGHLDEEIYLDQPQGFKAKGQETKVWRLKRALYGLKQSALAWWKELESSMKKLGFKRLLTDAGAFIHEHQGKTVIAIIYVDDAMFFGNDKVLVTRKKKQIMDTWECRDLGEASEFLCMRIKRKNSMIYIDQVDYLDKVLKHFNMESASVAATPLPAGWKPSENKEEPDAKRRALYQSIIGSLLYIMLGTRPDICYAVTKLAQFASNPSQEHLDKAKYICRYLVGTCNYVLVYNGKTGKGIQGYTDDVLSLVVAW